MGDSQANGADVDPVMLLNVTNAINQAAPVLARIIIPLLPNQPPPQGMQLITPAFQNMWYFRGFYNEHAPVAIFFHGFYLTDPIFNVIFAAATNSWQQGRDGAGN